MAAIGPGIKALGEVKSEGQYYQNQVAKTAAALLGVDYQADRVTGDVIEAVIQKAKK